MAWRDVRNAACPVEDPESVVDRSWYGHRREDKAVIAQAA
jgi:hypothetical protein